MRKPSPWNNNGTQGADCRAARGGGGGGRPTNCSRGETVSSPFSRTQPCPHGTRNTSLSLSPSRGQTDPTGTQLPDDEPKMDPVFQATFPDSSPGAVLGLQWGATCSGMRVRRDWHADGSTCTHWPGTRSPMGMSSGHRRRTRCVSVAEGTWSVQGGWQGRTRLLEQRGCLPSISRVLGTTMDTTQATWI